MNVIMHSDQRNIKAPSATFRQEAQMAANSTRELEATHNLEDPLERLRLLCLSKGATGILDLGRLFRRKVEGENKKINLEEFSLCLKEQGLEITDEEIQDLFFRFDSDESSTINMDEFLMHLRPPLSDDRKKVIDAAFNKIDKTGAGEITIKDLKRVYNVKSYSRYISGEESEESFMNTFLKNFDRDATREGKVSREEFFDYYSAISASIDNDCFFNLMMRQSYKL